MTACRMRLEKEVSDYVNQQSINHLESDNTWEEGCLSNTQTKPHGHKTAGTSRPSSGC